jgi:hypothetical protein
VEWGDIFTVARTLHFGNSFQLDLEKMDMGVRFDPAPGNNLLLLGRNEKKAGTMMFFAALDAMLQQLMFKRMVKPEAAPTFTVLDYRNESEVTQDDKLKWIAEKNNAYYNRNRSAEAIEKVYERFLQKKAGDPIEWFMIFDISKASDLRNDSMTGQGIRSLDMFKELLSDGPAKGVFLVVWCGDPEAYRTKMIYSLNHFSYRVVFDLSYDEARAYAKIPKDEDIRREDAYLSCSVRGGSGRPAKFRSYADPSQPWMELLAGRIGVE